MGEEEVEIVVDEEPTFDFVSVDGLDIAELVERSGKPMTVENVLTLLRTTEDLTTNGVADFMTASGNEKVLSAYMAEINVSGDFADALRLGFGGVFRLHDKPADMFRVLREFCKCYCEKNPEVNQEIMPWIALASIAVIVSSIPTRTETGKEMTPEEFAEAVLPHLWGDLISLEKLAEFYNSFLQTPLPLLPTGTKDFFRASTPVIKEFLLKKSKKPGIPRWGRRFFRLNNERLYYFWQPTGEAAHKPLGSISIRGLFFEKAGMSGKKIIARKAEGETLDYVKYDNLSAGCPATAMTGISELWFKVEVPARRDEFLLMLKWLSIQSMFVPEVSQKSQ